MKVKKIIYVLLTISLIAINFSIPSSNKIEAKTLRDLKQELARMEKEHEQTQSEKKYTEQEMASKKASISSINNEIDNIQQEMKDLTEEIEKLNEEIILKEQQIKEIVSYYQLSNGESAYLEYVFNAVDYTDFIYRAAIAEQLSSYNDELVDEYNQMIEDNKKKKEELSSKTVSLNKKMVSLQNELNTLGSQLSEVLEENLSIEDEIKSLKKTIDTYENTYKCSLDEDLTSCGRGKLPAGTKFFRPTNSGRISANYGWYYPWGYKQWHYGMDIAGTGHGANVYSVADGKVAYIVYRSSCGGNMVYIQHNINGVKYTSGYYHLASVKVKVGDIVTPQTVIGGVGGVGSIETWDKCSTGAHLHLQIAYGLIVVDYPGYSGFTARSFNPRLVINFPSEGSWYSNRTTKY